MPRRRISFDVAVNTPSAEREADKLKNIFNKKLSQVQVGTRGAAGAGGGGARGGGGGGGGGTGMPGSSLSNLLFGSSQYALAGFAYSFFSNLPQMVMGMDKLATSTHRAEQAFFALAGGMDKANALTQAFIEGSGNIATDVEGMEGAMHLFNLEMAKTPEQMRTFVTLTRGMSQATGRDVGYVQEQFALALANQSELRFDQLNLSVERHKQLMQELHQTYPEMNRDLLFQNAMLQQAMEKFYGLALAQSAVATSTEIASREMQNFHKAVSDVVSLKIVQPAAGLIGRLFGAADYNLNSAMLRANADEYRRDAERYRSAANQAVGNFRYGAENFGQTILTGRGMAQSRAQYMQANIEEPAQLAEGRAKVNDMLADLGDNLQRLHNAGAKIDPQWVMTLNEGGDAIQEQEVNLAYWNARLEATEAQMDRVSQSTDAANNSLMRFKDSAQILQETFVQLRDGIMGSVVGMVDELMGLGVSGGQVGGMFAGVQEKIDAGLAARAADLQAAQGDPVQQRIIYNEVMESILGTSRAMAEGIRESEAASKRASSELEQAAKAAEKAFVSAADDIAGTFEDMLHNVPGLYKPSEVTEEDLYLAKAGFPINYADDALRRLEDVAFNKTKRDDVDLGLWEKVLGQAAGTDPKVLAILARKRAEDLSLYANPEFAKQLINPDAVRDALHQQELSALGKQTLDAMFGIGTEGNNEYLKVFGVSAYDPIKDGLITEITTRGPIMGETLANAMYEGFNTKALQLPWVASLMSAINSEIGRAILEGLNNNAGGDTATAEGVPLEE